LSVSSLPPHTTTLEWVIFLLDLTLQVSGLSGTGTFGFLEADSLHRFRWAACQIDYLCELPSDKARRKALTGLPPSLFETYDRILGRILDCPPDTQMVCRKTLHWIGLPYPLRLSIPQLCEAISLPDDQDYLDDDDLVDPEEIARRCSSLVRRRTLMESRDLIEYAHFSVKEYLQNISPESRFGSFRFSEAEAMRSFTTTSLRFLMLSNFSHRPIAGPSEMRNISRRNQAHPFYPCAASHVLRYRLDIARCESPSPAAINEDNGTYSEEYYIKRLFAPKISGQFLSWVLEGCIDWMKQMETGIVSGDEEEEEEEEVMKKRFSLVSGFALRGKFSALHMAAMLRLPKLCTWLLAAGSDVNLGGDSCSPLHAAILGLHAIKGSFSATDLEIGDNTLYAETIKVLLDHGADTSARWGVHSPLLLALASGESGIVGAKVRPLIRHTTEIFDDAVKELRRIVSSGDLDDGQLHGIADAILQAYSHLERNSPETPKLWDAMASISRTILLRKRGRAGSPDSNTGNHGSQPISLVASIADEDFMEAMRYSVLQNLTEQLRELLADPRFAGPNAIVGPTEHIELLHLTFKDKYRDTSDCLRVLLESGINVNLKTGDGSAMVHRCAEDGTADALEALLDWGADAMVRTTGGDTVWHIAAKRGPAHKLEILVKCRPTADNPWVLLSRNGRTPLAEAVCSERVQEALYIISVCPRDIAVLQSDVPITHYAAGAGSQDLFTALVGLGADLSSHADDGSTPLHFVRWGCPASFATFLLSHYDVNHARRDGAYALETLLNSFFSPGARRDRGEHVMSQDEQLVACFLPPDHLFATDGRQPKHVWELICQNTFPFLGCQIPLQQFPAPQHTTTPKTHTYICRYYASLADILVCPLINAGLVATYEQQSHEPAFRPLIRALLNRSPYEIRCAWIPVVLTMILEASSWPERLRDDPLCVRLLMEAVSMHADELVEILLQHGASVYAVSGTMSVLEHACALEGDGEIFCYLLNKHSDESRINELGYMGWSLMHWATRGNSIQGGITKLKALFDRGANLNLATTDREKLTPMILAARDWKFALVQTLLDLGADPLVRNFAGWSVLHYTAWGGNKDTIEKLRYLNLPKTSWMMKARVSRTVGRSAYVFNQATILHIAALRGQYHVTAISDLVRDGLVDVDSRTECGCTALHLAALCGHASAVPVLLDLGADVNARRHDKWLPLDCASPHGHTPVINILLESGSGRTPGLPWSRNNELAEAAGQLDAGGPGDSPRSSGASDDQNPSRSLIAAFADDDPGYFERCLPAGGSIEEPIDPKKRCRCSLLATAVAYNKPRIATWLLSQGASTNVITCERHGQYRFWGIFHLAFRFVNDWGTIEDILDCALRQGVTWYGSRVLSRPLVLEVAMRRPEWLTRLLSHVRRNEKKYRQAKQRALPRTISFQTTHDSVLPTELSSSRRCGRTGHENAPQPCPYW